MLKKTSSRDEDEPPDGVRDGCFPYVNTPVVNDKASFYINFLPHLKTLNYKFYCLIFAEFLISYFLLSLIIYYHYSSFCLKINSCHSVFFIYTILFKPDF